MLPWRIFYLVVESALLLIRHLHSLFVAEIWSLIGAAFILMQRVLIGVDERRHGYEEQAPKGVRVPLQSGEPPVPNAGTVEPSCIGHRRQFPPPYHS